MLVLEAEGSKDARKEQYALRCHDWILSNLSTLNCKHRDIQEPLDLGAA